MHLASSPAQTHTHVHAKHTRLGSGFLTRLPPASQARTRVPPGSYLRILPCARKTRKERSGRAARSWALPSHTHAGIRKMHTHAHTRAHAPVLHTHPSIIPRSNGGVTSAPQRNHIKHRGLELPSLLNEHVGRPAHPPAPRDLPLPPPPSPSLSLFFTAAPCLSRAPRGSAGVWHPLVAPKSSPRRFLPLLLLPSLSPSVRQALSPSADLNERERGGKKRHKLPSSLPSFTSPCLLLSLSRRRRSLSTACASLSQAQAVPAI